MISIRCYYLISNYWRDLNKGSGVYTFSNLVFTAIMRSQLINEWCKNFLCHQDLNHGPWNQKAMCYLRATLTLILDAYHKHKNIYKKVLKYLMRNDFCIFKFVHVLHTYYKDPILILMAIGYWVWASDPERWTRILTEGQLQNIMSSG